MRLKLLAAALGALLAALSSSAEAAETNVAVAANFTEPAKEIAALFKQKTGDEAILSFGASGGFFTQIAHDAPYKVFLSADQDRPKAAVEQGFAVPGTVFTYAIGKLVLWSKVVDVTERRGGAESRQVLEAVDRQSRRRALRPRRHRDHEGARGL